MGAVHDRKPLGSIHERGEKKAKGAVLTLREKPLVHRAKGKRPAAFDWEEC